MSVGSRESEREIWVRAWRSQILCGRRSSRRNQVPLSVHFDLRSMAFRNHLHIRHSHHRNLSSFPSFLCGRCSERQSRTSSCRCQSLRPSFSVFEFDPSKKHFGFCLSWFEDENPFVSSDGCSLHFLFGKNLERATRIVDQRGVKRISGEPSGRSIFQVYCWSSPFFGIR